MFENLTRDNFLLFAMRFYNNPNCTTTEEFVADIKRIRYIKRLFSKYKEGSDLKHQLIFNHLCILYNVFDHKALTRMLFFRLDGYLDCLKPFLMLMNYWPTDIGLVNGKKIIDSDIGLDIGIVQALRKI